jgi:thymidine phosphorylase
MAAARALSDRMLAVAGRSGLKMRVALSDMGQVLGREAGNALEVRAVIRLLRGQAGCPRLLSLSLALAAELLCLGGLAPSEDEAMRMLRGVLASGEAAERFGRMVAALGGPVDLLDRPDAYLASAPVQREVPAPESGYLETMDVRAVGQAVVQLGGGRTRPDQYIDPAVGLSAVIGVGDRIERGQPLAVVHARNDADAQAAVDSFLAAISISGTRPEPVPLLLWHEPSGLPA